MKNSIINDSLHYQKEEIYQQFIFNILDDFKENHYFSVKGKILHYLPKPTIYFYINIHKKTEINQYSLISYDQALENVKNNKMYAFGGVKEYLNYNRIANVKLTYFFEPQSRTFLPYYEIYYEVDYEKCEKANYLVNDGLKHYGSVYVPAISDEDIKANYGDAVIDLAQ